MSSTRKSEVLYPLGAGLLLYFIFSISGRLYTDVDNYTVSIIINGLLGNNNYCQHQHPFLCVLMGLVKKIVPTSDCFTLSIHLLLILAIAFVIMILRERFTESGQRLIIWSAILYLSFAIVIWSANYTVWAGFFCFAGMLGVFVGKDKKGNIIAGTLFFMLGLMLRHRAGELFLPYIGLIVAGEFISCRGKGKDADGRKAAYAVIKRILPLIVGIVLVLSSRAIFFSIEPWKSGWEYEKARATLADYPVTQWEDLEANATDEVDRLLYKGAGKWIYADTELMSLDNLKKMADAGKKNAVSLDFHGIWEAIRFMAVMTVHNRVNILLPMLALLLLTVMAAGRGRFATFESIAAFLGSLVIMVYFVVRGRAPVRVWQPVMFAAYSVVLTILAQEKPSENKVLVSDKMQKTVRGAIAAAITAVSVICLIYNGHLHSLTTPVNAGVGADDGEYSRIYGTDTRYILCGWAETLENEKLTTSYLYGWYKALQQYCDQGKLPPEEFFRHYISSGWFGYGQEYYSSLLHEIGMDNPVSSLIEQDDVYLLDMSEDTLFREYFYVYLYDHYGDMMVRKTGELYGYPIYQFRRGL
ncbi:MAG: hypothetical protein K6G19_12555 [Lachnospiraceae bacterium]|nr:hypothetical protein [Lachnospiraceae bacterium]